MAEDQTADGGEVDAPRTAATETAVNLAMVEALEVLASVVGIPGEVMVVMGADSAGTESAKHSKFVISHLCPLTCEFFFDAVRGHFRITRGRAVDNAVVNLPLAALEVCLHMDGASVVE